MIEADDFLTPLKKEGFTFVSGVPCSFLTPFINRVIDSEDFDYIGASSEGEAVGINLGAHLAGRSTVGLCQNSGLGNMVNPLTSLNMPFRVPSLLVVTHRGEPGRADEPQHELMGRVTHSLLDTIEVSHLPFPESQDQVGPTLTDALGRMQRDQLPVALVMRKGSVAPSALMSGEETRHRHGLSLASFPSSVPMHSLPTRMQAIETVLKRVSEETAIIATTGKTGRELFTAADRKQHFYVVGGMGTASAIGLGVAINQPGRPVVVLDGDGAALMKLGAFATIGAQAPRNLLHLVLDNQVHDSTGGQSTTSGSCRFAEIAQATSYRHVAEAASLDSLDSLIPELLQRDGPNLLHLRIQPGSISPLGRPDLTPVAVKERFMKFLQSPSA